MSSNAPAIDGVALAKPTVRRARNGARARRCAVAGWLATYGVFAAGAAFGISWHGIAFGQSQAGASSETGSLITRHPASVNGLGLQAARQTTRQFALCAVKAQRAAVMKFVRTPIDSPEYPKLMDRVATDDCLGAGELQMDRRLMRAALFEGLYLDRFGRIAAPDFADVPPIDYAAGYGTERPWWVTNAIGFGRFGDCVARADPANARIMILSLPGSSAEDQAVRSVMPQLSPCFPAGLQITLSRSALRGAVAEGLYRLTAARLDNSTAGKN